MRNQVRRGGSEAGSRGYTLFDPLGLKVKRGRGKYSPPFNPSLIIFLVRGKAGILVKSELPRNARKQEVLK